MSTDPSLSQAEEPTSLLVARVRRIEDIEAVCALIARYHQLCDGWDHGTHRDPEAIAALFTEDGVWDETTRRPPPRGRAEIVAFARELQFVTKVVHFVVNPLIAVVGDTATGECKGILRVQLRDSSPLVWVMGVYRIVARRTPAGWRFGSLVWEPASHSRYDPDR